MEKDLKILDVLMRRSWLTFSVVWVLCILPIAVAHNMPLHDYPFHIARMDILSLYQPGGTLSSYYSIYSYLLPNVGMDLIIQALAKVLPVELAGRVFLALTIAVQLSGCMQLHRALYRQTSNWPLAAALVVFNWIFLFAFI